MKRFTYFIIPVLGIVGVIAVGYLMRYQSSPLPTTSSEGGGKLPGVVPINPATNPANSQNNQNNGANGGGLGTPGTQGGQYLGQKFGVVSQVLAADYFVDSSNNLTIVQPSGQIVKIAPTGEQTTLSPSAISNLVQASFSYDGKKVLALFGSASAPQASVFDTMGKAWQPLPQTALFPSWSPSDYKIVYLNEKSSGKALTTLDTGNAKAKPVEWITLHEEDLQPLWIAPTKILLKGKASAQARNTLWNFDMNKKILSSVVEGAGLETNWSAGANQGIVFTSTGGFGGSMQLVDLNGAPLRNFSLATLPSKCAFNKKVIPIAVSSTQTVATTTKTKTAPQAPTSTISWFIDCAIPRDANQMKSFALPDTYNKKGVFTADDFYELDLMTGSLQTVFADNSQIVDATQMKILNNTLFFINRINQKIYAISLK